MARLKRAHDGKIAGLYDLDKTLGRGHFAVVKLAKHVFTGEKVAVKVIDKTKLDPVARGHLFQEVRCMKMVQHPNVVRLYEAIDTATKLYLVLELADGGDLYDCIMKHEGGLSEEVAKCYFAQIVHAISYCHRLHVVHRDLKPENVVFFQQRGLVKLTDFGFSNRFQPGKKLNTSCGSLAYSAPEILLGDEYDAPAVDIWSLGVILFMLVCGQPPFHETNDSETLTMIMDCKYTVPAHISHACKDLIGRMLQREPKQRASLEQIEGHDWLQGVDPSPSTKLSTPLVSHRSLSEEEHGCTMQRMVLGGISDRDTITEALESDKYNHITATYFLLAERILREKQEKEQHSQSRSASPSKAQFRQSWPSRMDIHQGDSLGGPSISHPGCPQSPARSAESLHRGPRTALLDLSQLQGSGYAQRRGHQEGPKAPAKPHSLGPGSGLSCVEEDEVGEGEEVEEDEEGGGVSSPQVLLHCKGTSSASSSSPSSSSSASNRLAACVSAPVLHKGEEQGEEVEKEFTPSEQGREWAGGAGQASPGSGQSCGVSRTTSGLVESLKLMSLCLSSQLHSLAVGGAGEPHNRPVWRMCMGGSTGSLDRVSLLGGPTPRAHLHHQPAPGDLLADPLLEGSRSGPLRLDELDLARENQRNLKNQVLQMPLSDKTLSVNTRHSPKEALLYTPAPHNCCQVI